MDQTDAPISREELAKKMDAFQTTCRDKGLRVTPQRMAVYQALVETHDHPSAEMVFRRVRQTFPTISLDTVNRTLLTLSDIGVAYIVEGTGEAKRFDAETSTHQHFKCVRCKRIIDFHYEPFDRISVPEDFGDGLIVHRATVYVEGICDRCAKSEQ
jgi:Fur family peroxide stress response transcriptional regulator